jgi:hypothetical protein
MSRVACVECRALNSLYAKVSQNCHEQLARPRAVLFVILILPVIFSICAIVWKPDMSDVDKSNAHHLIEKCWSDHKLVLGSPSQEIEVAKICKQYEADFNATFGRAR